MGYSHMAKGSRKSRRQGHPQGPSDTRSASSQPPAASSRNKVLLAAIVLGTVAAIAWIATRPLGQATAPSDARSLPTAVTPTTAATAPPAASPRVPQKAQACADPTSGATDPDDPTRDGWDTEAFNTEAGAQLSALGKLLSQPEKIASTDLGSLATNQFACQSLVPAKREEVFRDTSFQIERGQLDVARAADPASGEHRGLTGLAAALEQLARPFAGATDLHFKFKIFRAEPAADSQGADANFALSGHTPNSFHEQNAT